MKLFNRELLFYMIIFSCITVVTPSSSVESNKLSLKKLIELSEIIVQGNVISKTSFEKKHGRIYSEITFVVTEKFKGKITVGENLKLTYLGGTINNITTFVPEYPQFITNEESILFLYKSRSGNNNLRVVGLSQGKFNILLDQNIKIIMRDHFEIDEIQIDEGEDKLSFTDRSKISLTSFLQLLRASIDNNQNPHYSESK